MQKGLKNFKYKKEKYDSEIDNFIHKYYFALDKLRYMIDAQKPEEIKEFLSEINKSASLLGAKNLVKSTKDLLRSCINKTVTEETLLVDLFSEDLLSILDTMQKYRTR